MEAAAIVLILAPLVAYLGYPMVVVIAATLAPRRRVPVAGETPTVSILICAHNEGERIAAKLESVLVSVGMGVEVIVGDDGSTDDTAAVVAGFAGRGIRLIRCARGGKAATLDRIVREASGAVLVMTDADPLFDADTLPALLAPFADPGIGAVAGCVEVIGAGRRPGRFAFADRAFRAYESAIRVGEDRLFGCVSADGGLYAIRAGLVPAVPGDVTDDFFISTAAVAAGYRIAFAPGARVHEHSLPGDRQQFRRRVRITVRGLTGLWRRRALMNPVRFGWYAVALVLHKLARRLAPLALPLLWLVSGWLGARGSVGWGVVCAGLGGAAVLGAIGWLSPVRLPRPFGLVYGAVLHLAGLATGAALFASGRRYAQWTPKSAEAA